MCGFGQVVLAGRMRGIGSAIEGESRAFWAAVSCVFWLQQWASRNHAGVIAED